MRSASLLSAGALLLLTLSMAAEGHKFWTKLHCSPPTESTIDFQLYLRWENEAALDTYVHTGVTSHLSFNPQSGDIQESLSSWRSLLRPTEASHRAVAAWLTQHGVNVDKYCAVEWDSLHCSKVPVGAAQTLFQKPFCAFRQNFDEIFVAAPHLRSSKVQPGLFILADATPSDLTGLPAAIKYVGGVTVFNPTIRPHRRELMPTMEDVPYHYWPMLSDAAPVIISGLGLPQFGGANEMAYAVVAVSCKDGTQAKSTNANSTSPLNTWCGPNVPYPIQLQTQITGIGSVTVTLTEEMCAPASSQTFTSSFWPLILNQTHAPANDIVCQVDLSTLVFNSIIPTWAQLAVRATTVFSDLTSSNTTTMHSFWEGSYGAEMRATWPSPLVPSDIKNLYGVPSYDGIASPKSAQGILEFSDSEFPRSGFQKSDLKQFLIQYGVVSAADADAYLASYLKILGGAAMESRGETSLDIEMMMSIAQNGYTYLWNIINGPGEQYLHWAQAFIAWGQTVTSGAATDPTISLPSSVWSISYGGPEWGNATEMSMLNNYFKLLSAAGVTTVISTGDSGAGFQPYLVDALMAPAVSYPASSPYVVAAGATALKAIDDLLKPIEVVCSSADGNVITVGGGFSVAFDLPVFQSAAVNAYLASIVNTSMPPQYPKNKRAIPDVSAIGAWVNIVMSNMTIPVFGTSISAPVFSSLVSLVNDHLRRAGKPTISLANNWLYNTSHVNGTVFTDVTVGSNCAGEQHDFPTNFPTWPSNACYSAVAGWDPASGRGSPSYVGLLELFGAPLPIPPQSSPADKSNTGAIVGGAVGGVVVAGLAVLAFFKFRKPAYTDGESDRLVQ